MSTTAPGWYPDPSGRHESRWWDGGRWTEHVSDRGATTVDPGTAPGPPTWAATTSRPPVGGRDRLPAVVGLVGAAVLLVSAFLPWFEVSVDFAGVSISEDVTGVDGGDGVIIIVLALVAGVLALLRLLGTGVPQVGIGMAAAGLLATVIGLIDLGNDDPDTEAEVALSQLADVSPAVGLWLVIVAGLVVGVAGLLVLVWGRARRTAT